MKRMIDAHRRHLEEDAKFLEQVVTVTDEMLTYLDELRDSGVTNMFGATPYLQRKFGLSQRDAKTVLVAWMETFGARHPDGKEEA
jgi:hypothetical protein